MCRLMRHDKRIAIGVERYAHLIFKRPLTQDLFTYERFFNIEPGDTFYSDLSSSHYQQIVQNYPSADYVGDKIPRLFKSLDELFVNFPQARVIAMLRNIFDISVSYEARADDPDDAHWPDKRRTESAIKDWTALLKALQRYADDGRVFPVIYEDFFSEQGSLEPLYNFLQLELNPELKKAYQDMTLASTQLENKRSRALPISAVRQICETAPFSVYRQVLKNIRNKNSQ